VFEGTTLPERQPNRNLLIDRLQGFGLFKYVMTKEKLIEIIRTLLKTDADLRFLLQLKEKEIETLVACIRRRTDQVGK
jgi:hypothetical protein